MKIPGFQSTARETKKQQKIHKKVNRAEVYKYNESSKAFHEKTSGQKEVKMQAKDNHPLTSPGKSPGAAGDQLPFKVRQEVLRLQ
jgi:hypothetical protein